MNYFNESRGAVVEKIKESASSVLPIFVIVLLMCLFIVPIQTDLVLCFVLGAVMLVFGMGFFSLGADVSMTPIGNKIGTALTKTKNLPLILVISFFLGFAVTIAEPDLQVLAETVPHINSFVLLATVGVGVGLFLSICMFRILTGLSLRWILIIAYVIVFGLAIFTDRDFLSIAFDSGGVASGPMTATFMLRFMMGASLALGGNVLSDAFGIVALVAMMPLLSIQLVGFYYGRIVPRRQPDAESYGDYDIIDLWEESA